MFFIGYTSYESNFVAAQQCEIRERREIRQLSQEELYEFVDAVKTINEKGEFYARMALLHHILRKEVHGNAMFLPWHRYFLYMFEKELQKVHPRVMLPYWDTAFDSQYPTHSPVLSELMMGGNGRPEDNCVIDGLFANFEVNITRPLCLRRKYDQENVTSSFPPIEAVLNVIHTRENFGEFSHELENRLHNSVHRSIGGDMTLHISPKDPIFYLHHANVDRIWNRWQLRSNKHHDDFNAYVNATNPVTVDDKLPYYNVTVRDILDTKNLCYTYSGVVDRRSSNVTNLERRSYTAEPASTTDNNFVMTPINVSDDWSIRYDTAQCEALSATDQHELVAIRDVLPIPEKIIKMNNGNVEAARRSEEEMRQIIRKINRIPNYISPSALIYRPEVLAKLVETEKTFTVTRGTSVATIQIPKKANGDVCVNQLQKTVDKALQKMHVVRLSGKKPGNQLKPAELRRIYRAYAPLVELIGHDGIQDLINDYGACHFYN
jgi:hypothetical protein